MTRAELNNLAQSIALDILGKQKDNLWQEFSDSLCNANADSKISNVDFVPAAVSFFMGRLPLLSTEITVELLVRLSLISLTDDQIQPEHAQ